MNRVEFTAHYSLHPKSNPANPLSLAKSEVIMKRQRGKKSNAQLIIGVLLSGNELTSKEISEIIEKNEGRKIKIQDVASMLSKISNEKKSALGFFIQRVKDGNSFTYHVVEEALGLSEDQAYGLTLKIGKGRYPLDQAVKDFPGLKKYLVTSPPSKSKPGPKRKDPNAEKALKPRAKALKPAPPAASVVADQSMDKLAADILRKIIEGGDVDVNVNVTLKIEGLED
jgi:hypothetical protein